MSGAGRPQLTDNQCLMAVEFDSLIFHQTSYHRWKLIAYIPGFSPGSNCTSVPTSTEPVEAGQPGWKRLERII
jgi:hypothetical protein